MKKILLAVTFAALSSIPAFATIQSCSSVGSTLDTLIALGAGTCDVGDKTFSNFTYSPGTGDPAAGNVTVGYDNNHGIFQYGLQFGTNTSVWNSNFTLSYTETVDPAACQTIYGAGYTCTITAAQGQYQGGLANPSNTSQMTITLTGANINLNDTSTGNYSQQVSLASLTSTSVGIAGTSNTTYPIDSFGLDIYQTVQAPGGVPEPMSMSLMGVGLLGLGFIGRKLRK